MDHFQYFDKVVPPVLNLVSTAHSILGTSTVETIAGTLHKVGMNLIPLWNACPRVRNPYLLSTQHRNNLK